MIVSKIISGGQTGVDIGALEAALQLQVPTGGMMPRHFLTEDGLRPSFAEKYGMKTMPTSSYAARTRQNIADSDATLVLVDTLGQVKTGGTGWTLRSCEQMGKLCLVVEMQAPKPIPAILTWLIEHDVNVLNVAGPRESKAPGIGSRAKEFMLKLLQS